MTALFAPARPSIMNTGHICTNCERPAMAEAGIDPRSGSAVYFCPTCGQREAVSWRHAAPQLVVGVRVLDGPCVILGEC